MSLKNISLNNVFQFINNSELMNPVVLVTISHVLKLFRTVSHAIIQDSIISQYYINYYMTLQGICLNHIILHHIPPHNVMSRLISSRILVQCELPWDLHLCWHCMVWRKGILFPHSKKERVMIERAVWWVVFCPCIYKATLLAVKVDFLDAPDILCPSLVNKISLSCPRNKRGGKSWIKNLS